MRFPDLDSGMGGFTSVLVVIMSRARKKLSGSIVVHRHLLQTSRPLASDVGIEAMSHA